MPSLLLPASGTVFRSTLTGDGRPGPIEARLGRRLIRLVDPASIEGRRLFDDGCVDLIDPEGRSLGTTSLRDAQERLRCRLEDRLTNASFRDDA